ncbi:MAG: T9SS type A sorting domain-containing protein [Bacteroidota bacterium]|nr:T9SS type A sorting domain-containing protein [Bacteroidota bacterium]
MTVPRGFLLLFLLASLPYLPVTRAAAQVSATDLSYFPLHTGNVWVYQVSTFAPHEPHWTPRDTIRVEVTGDSLYPNGKRYFVFNTGGPLRVDSTDGRVYAPMPYPPQSNGCPDSTEQEVYNLAVDSTWQYSRCPDGGIVLDPCMVIPLGSERVAALNLMRPQRIWGCWALYSKLAQGIGISLKEGGGVSGNQHLLIYARINGTEYWPVELKSFTATSRVDDGVLLRWETANEVQNLGFTIERREAARSEEEWTRLAFVPSHVQEGSGGEYRYTDYPAQAGVRGPALQYRLLQHDYDGSVAALPVAEVQLAGMPAATGLTLWPNPAPAGEVLHVALPAGQAGALELYDALGRKRLSRNVSSQAALPTAGLSPGMYFLRLRDVKETIVEKVVVR